MKPDKSGLDGTARTSGSAFRIVLLYVVLAGLWIVFSDRAVTVLFADPIQITVANTIKGWLFVAVTALLLYTLIQRLLNQALAASREAVNAQQDNARAMQLLEAISEYSPDAIFAKDAAGNYLLVNPETTRVLGKPVEQILGHNDSELFPLDQAQVVSANDRRVLAEERIMTYEENVATVDGERTFLATKGPMRDSAGKVSGLFGISRDITERKLAEEKIRRLTQVYAALSECNQAIVRCKNQDELFPRICRAAVQYGGMKLARISLLVPDSIFLKTVASFGEQITNLEEVPVSADNETPLGRGGSGTAVREGRPVWVQDFVNDPRTQPWHERGVL
ncbi:MAG: PAS domain-containing protein, partial [Betaproteobacteria bacterium]